MALSITTYEGSEIRAFCYDQGFAKVGVAITAGLALTEGTLLGKVTATGKFSAYNNALSNGTEVCLGILDRTITAADTNRNVGMYISGAFVESRLTGINDDAKTDLGSRSVQGVLIF